MSNLGQYQNIVVEAKKVGGPDILIDIIKKESYNSGASDMKNKLVFPLLLIGIGIGSASVILYQKTKQKIYDKKVKRLLAERESEQAEEFLKKELESAIEVL